MEVGKIAQSLLSIGNLSNNKENPQNNISLNFKAKEVEILNVSYRMSTTQLKGGNLKDRIREQAIQLYSTDPKLAQNYLTLIEFLNDNAPGLVEKFVDMVDELFNQWHMSRKTKPSLELKIELHYKLQENLTYKTQGKEIKLSYEKSIDLKLKLHIGIKQPIRKIDPIIIDMKGDGIKPLSLKNHALFDIDGDGKKEKVAFIEGDDAFLFIDRNFNNMLDSGRELIGTNPIFENGFEELRRYDFNKDNIIDAKDPIFNQLKIFQDKDGDKRISPYEIKSAKKAGIKAIYLNYKKNTGNPQNLIGYSTYRGNFKNMFIGDYYLSYQDET